LAINIQAPINEGVAFEMQSLGLGGEVLGVVKSSVRVVKRDLTDWANVIN
tara:strand:+ start:986 stop:1135 length:150 start_codon:yes stop_codon:yes gene_type:complete